MNILIELAIIKYYARVLCHLQCSFLCILGWGQSSWGGRTACRLVVLIYDSRSRNIEIDDHLTFDVLYAW